MFQNIVSVTHFIVTNTLHEGNFAVDATVGNGNDTLMLAQRVGHTGHVLGLDIQENAIKTTKTKCQEHDLMSSVTLIHDNHANIKNYLTSFPEVNLALFNLGYLPSGDKSITTQANTTIPAIATLLQHLAISGQILIASYIGHSGGKNEYHQIKDYLSSLDQAFFSCSEYHFINQKNHPPRLFIIERRK